MSFIIWLLNRLPEIFVEQSEFATCILAQQYRNLSEALYKRYLELLKKCNKQDNSNDLNNLKEKEEES